MANKYEYEYEYERNRLPTVSGVEGGQVVAALRHWARVKPIVWLKVKWPEDEVSMTVVGPVVRRPI